MSAADQLADALIGAGIEAPEHLAQSTDIPKRIAANALCGRPVATGSYLRICRAINFDPAPALGREAIHGSDFDFSFLAMGLKIRRGLNHHSDRAAAKAIGVKASTVCRAERGDYVGIEVVLKICRYVGVHPFGYMRDVSARLGFFT